MPLGSRRTFLGTSATAVEWLVGVALAGGQAPPEQKPPMAEEVFKNIRVLRGIPVDENELPVVIHV